MMAQDLHHIDLGACRWASQASQPISSKLSNIRIMEEINTTSEVEVGEEQAGEDAEEVLNTIQ